MSCFNRDTSPRDLSIMTLLSMLRIWIKVWIRNYFFTFKIDMNFQVGICKLLFKAIKVWELNSWLLWYFGRSEAIEITVIAYLDWIDIFCFCFRIPWYELGDYPNWAILYLYDIGLPFFQRLNRKGLSDKRSAVGFCLGSGLFGSYNSD